MITLSTNAMNKVALITGAAKRLGAETTRHLHQLGFDVVIHYNNSSCAAKELADELNNRRIDSAGIISYDLNNIENISDISNFLADKFNRLDVLVNNASSFYPTPITQLKFTDYNDLINTNMTAPLFLTQACHPLLAKNNGVVINMCDIHASRPLKGHTAYCMAKAGLMMMTHSLANELAPEVRVNGIAPGAIEWPTSGITNDDKAQVISQIPLGHIGSPQDIASAIGYLVQAKYVTGQVLTVDGGRQHTASKGA